MDPSNVPSKPAREIRVGKVNLPPSPIVALPADRLGKDNAPPKRHEVPQPDLKIAPTTRNATGKIKPIRETNRTTGATQAAPPTNEPQGKPKAEPKEKPKNEAKAATPGGESSATPQAEPQRKPNAEPKNKPKQ